VKSLATLGNELYSGKTSIPFVGRRRIWYLIAVIIIAGSATLLATVGLTPGIDFKGGSEITVTGLSSPSERPANDVLSKKDLTAGSSVTTMGSSSVRVQTSQLSKERLDSLAGELATAYKTDTSNVSATTVGPTWSSDVTKKAARGLVLFFIFVGLLICAVLYGYNAFPLANGWLPILAAMTLLVIASQAVGVFMIGVLPTVRLGLSFASLFGMLGFSICGLSYPVTAMYPPFHALSYLYPLRHYLLIYVDQALNGRALAYTWGEYVWLAAFFLLPLTIYRNLKRALLYFHYIP